MGIYCYDDKSGSLYAHLADGFLPNRASLIQTAEQVAKRAGKENSYCVAKSPLSWKGWEVDYVFEHLAYNIRGSFCRNRPAGHSGYVWSEAWLLNPHKWEKGFELTGVQDEQAERRLLITLHKGCDFGKQCLSNLLETSGMNIIPDEKYRNPGEFREVAEQILDEIAVPFQAPCIIAGERIGARGEYLAFGK